MPPSIVRVLPDLDLLAKVLRQHLGESDSHLKSARRSKEALVDSR